MTRWGIAGTGGVAQLMAATLRGFPGADVTAVGSRSPARTPWRFADVVMDTCSYEALFAHPCVDVVYIATPASHHYRHALAALQAGKHVLVEKPFTVNAAQANILRVLADASDLFLMEAAWQRFMPAWTQLRMLIDEQPIGEIRSLQASFGGRADYRPDLRPFRNDLAGGALMDGGVYPIHLAHLLFGAPESVYAGASMLPSGVDGDVAVTLVGPDAQLSALQTSITTPVEAEARIMGTEGMIHLNANFTNPGWINVLRPGEEPTCYDFSPDRPRLAYEVDEVHRCIEAGHLESPVMPVAESCEIMGTMDRVRAEIGLRFTDEAEAL